MKNLFSLIAVLLFLFFNSALCAQSLGSKPKVNDGFFNRAVTASYHVGGVLSSEYKFSLEVNPMNKGVSILYSRGFYAGSGIQDLLESSSQEFQVRYYFGETANGEVHKNRGWYVGLYSQKRENFKSKTNSTLVFNDEFDGDLDHLLFFFFPYAFVDLQSNEYIEKRVVAKNGALGGYKMLRKNGITFDAYVGLGHRKRTSTFSNGWNPKVKEQFVSPRMSVSLGWSF